MRLTKAGMLSLLIVVSLLLVLFSGQLVLSLVQRNAGRPVAASTTPTPTVQSSRRVTHKPTENLGTGTSTSSPFFTPNNVMLTSRELPGGYSVIYEQGSNLIVVSSSGDSRIIPAQGYVYNEAVPPILTPSGQVIYSGDGIWSTDISSGTTTQIADLSQGQVITSMALSKDGKMVAWSTEPADGTGTIDLHAGPLAAPSVVYEQSALNCPCFRIFSFMNCSGPEDVNPLLLSPNTDIHEVVHYRLRPLVL